MPPIGSLCQNLILTGVIALLGGFGGARALAQAESFLLGPGSSVGPSTKVKPKNCVTGPDGSITCDTQLENSPSDSQAKPIYDQFKN
jgi:hypothetical protein